MNVDFDSATGRLRLDQDAFSALVARTAGDDLPEEVSEDLSAAGVLVDGRVRPDLGLEAVVDPTAVAELTMISDTGRDVRGQIWVAPGAAAYLMTGPDDTCELLRTPPGFFCVSIARATGLGPRPRAALTPWTLPQPSVEDLLSADPDRRRPVCDTIAAGTGDPVTARYADRLAAGPWWKWGLQVQWPAAPGTADGRSLHVLDTEEGLVVLSEHGQAVAFDPVSPTEVWQLLTMILPGDDELLLGGALSGPPGLS